MLRSEWLQSFAAFAEHRNFTRAAASMHLSQPALHVQIRKLTEELGMPLYRKRGRQLELTEAGVRLLAHCRDAAERSDLIVEELRTGTSHELLTVAAGTGAFLYLLGPAIREFIRTSPAKLALVQCDRTHALTAVRSGDANVGIAVLDSPPNDLHAEQLAQVDQTLVLPKRHPLAKRRSVELSDLAGQSLIVPPEGNPQRATLHHALTLAGVPWRIAVEATGWQLALHFVRLGMGLTIVNGCCELPADLVGRRLKALPRVCYWLFTRKGGRASAELARFCAIAKSIAP